MRRARLCKNGNGTFDLTFSGVTVAEARILLKGVAASEMPESFGELTDQLFDKESGMPITHLRSPIVIGDIV